MPSIAIDEGEEPFEDLVKLGLKLLKQMCCHSLVDHAIEAAQFLVDLLLLRVGFNLASVAVLELKHMLDCLLNTILPLVHHLQARLSRQSLISFREDELRQWISLDGCTQVVHLFEPTFLHGWANKQLPDDVIRQWKLKEWYVI